MCQKMQRLNPVRHALTHCDGCKVMGARDGFMMSSPCHHSSKVPAVTTRGSDPRSDETSINAMQTQNTGGDTRAHAERVRVF